MRARALLAAGALLLWAAAWLWPGRQGAGREWWLIDASASMAGAALPAGAANEPERTRWFARGLARNQVAEAEQEVSALGAALLALRGELRTGDRLHVFTDGRATDTLPPRALYADCQITAHAPPAGPRLVELRAPPAWPANGEVALEVRVEHAQWERAEISLEAAPGEVEVLRAIPVGADRLRLEVRARNPQQPPALLRLRWREGSRGSARAVTLAPPSGAPARVIEPEAWSAAEAEFVRAGGTVLLASPRLSSWAALPAEFKLFQTDSRQPPVTVLLDRSGSMEQGGLDEARALLSAWATEFATGPGLRVQAFAASLEAPLDPAQAPERAQLAALLPFGPTHLAAALSEACAALPADAHLILISDGRAEAPAEGWLQWRAAVVGSRRLLCVPAGADHDALTLAAIGEPITQGEFGARLVQAFDRAQETVRADGFAVPGASLPVPARLALTEARAPFTTAAGAELLMQDPAGHAVLAQRRAGAGAVLGLAASAVQGWPAALDGAWAASQAGRGGWENGELQVVAGPPPPRALQGDRRLDLILLDPGPPARWRVQDTDPRLPVTVSAPDGGRAWIQPAAADAEWTAGDQAWAAWLAADEGSRNRGGPRPTLLIAALFAASLVFFLAARARA